MWIDPENQIAMVLMVQNSDLNSKQLQELYLAYQKQAVARFSKAGKQGTAAN